MNAALLEPPPLVPELGSVTTVQALTLKPIAAIKATFSRIFIVQESRMQVEEYFEPR
jgi:hypothetical protein